jgi:hypothetical protein
LQIVLDAHVAEPDVYSWEDVKEEVVLFMCEFHFFLHPVAYFLGGAKRC